MAERRDRIASIAQAHTGCSAVTNRDQYVDVVVREADRTPARLPYYDGVSSCALFAIGCLRLAGCSEPECATSYLDPHLRDAMVDLQALARRFGAWVSSSPPVPLMQRGDIWIIADANGNNAHTGVCTADAVQAADGSITVATAEGGQFDGHNSTAIGAFTRTFVRDGARLRLGQRYLLGFADASQLPVPDSNVTVPPDAAA